MSTLELGPLLGLLALGALHGVNPAMGWLFAVALGMQEKKGRAVWRALPPLAVGHAASVAAVVMVAALAGAFVPHRVLQWCIAATLLAFGVHRLVRRHRHPRLSGMRVGPVQLTVWSFLMATAHGAGLMVLPLLVAGDGATVSAASAGAHAGHAAHGAHAAHAAQAADVLAGQAGALLAASLHALAYLAVTAVIALVVYHRVGLRLLRTAWINLDVIWAGALIATALITPFV
jgi:hypothetical protein